MRRVVYLAVLAATLVPAVTASAESLNEKQLAQKVGSHLKQSGQLHDYRVGVKFHDGVAYLTGSVANADQRDTAVRLAQQVDGVTHVVSKLEFPTNSNPNTRVIETNAAKSDSDGDSDFGEALHRASFEGPQNDASSVTQAFQQSGEAQAPPMQQNPGFQRQASRQMMPQARRSNMPMPSRPIPGGMAPIRQASCPTCNGGGGGMAPGMGMGPGPGMGGMGGGEPAPMGFVPGGGTGRGPSHDNPQMPGYAWPSYASYPNYAALTYPQQYSPTAWPYIGPFYPYPQVPLAWRKVSLEWDDGWWFLDFSSHNSSH